MPQQELVSPEVRNQVTEYEQVRSRDEQVTDSLVDQNLLETQFDGCKQDGRRDRDQHPLPESPAERRDHDRVEEEQEEDAAAPVRESDEERIKQDISPMQDLGRRRPSQPVRSRGYQHGIGAIQTDSEIG
jgi:hypothetical protein